MTLAAATETTRIHSVASCTADALIAAPCCGDITFPQLRWEMVIMPGASEDDITTKQ